MNKRKSISENIKRKLYAESMGKCMNPDCQIDLFINNGDILEKAHIVPHSDTADNSFENLILLCPNCHTNFDKNSAFSEEEVKQWKTIRQEDVNSVFAKKFDTFEALEEVIRPILEENKKVYENYYLRDNSKLWKQFEEKILMNNQKLKLLLTQNRNLFQKSSQDEYSNLATIDELILHINEFYFTRNDEEKIRTVLFPKKVNSIFGLDSYMSGLPPSTEALECLIAKLLKNNIFINITLDIDLPYLEYKKDNKIEILYLDDEPRVRQLYYKYYCPKPVGLRLKSLTYILKWLKQNNIEYTFPNFPILSDIQIKGKLFKFVYEYCLSKEKIISLAPEQGVVIFNLFNFNGGCISEEAYNQAEMMDIELLLHNNFYKFVRSI